MALTPVTEKIFEILKTRKEFSMLSSEALRELAAVAVYQHYKAGQELWASGDPGDFCVYMMEGLFEISRSSGTESETCVGIFGPSDTIGISAILNKTNYPGTARALNESRVLKFYMRSLLSDKKASAVHSEISIWLREMLLKHEQILRDKIDILTAGTVEDRLFELLKHFVRRFGIIQGSFKYIIPISITKSKAAKLIGIRSETAIRLINDWQRKKLIEWTDDKITLHNLQLIERYVIQQHAKG